MEMQQEAHSQGKPPSKGVFEPSPARGKGSGPHLRGSILGRRMASLKTQRQEHSSTHDE